MDKRLKQTLENIPFAPARCPFFYGWFLLLAGTLGIIVSAPGQTIGVSAFIEPLIRDIGLDRTALSMAYGIGTLSSAMLLTFGGRLYDRIGARWSGALSSLALGITLVGLGRLDRLAAGLSGNMSRLSPAAAAMLIATVGFFFLRFSGQGMLTLVSRNMVMKWFGHRRGLANGVMSVFIGLAFSASPPLFNGLIGMLSWQRAWSLLGWIVGAGFTLFALLFYRDNPESCGLLPEGGKTARPGAHRFGPARDYTLKEAVRTRIYWMYTLALSLQALYGTAFAFHVESIMGRAGFDADTAYRVFLPTAAISVTLGLVAGWISDHIPLTRLLALQIAGMIVGLSGLLINSGWVTFGLVVAGNGLATAMFSVLLSVTWPRYFGCRHLGAISGFHLTFNVMCSAIGPAMFALSIRFTGGYHLAIGICLAVAIALLLQVPRLGRNREAEE